MDLKFIPTGDNLVNYLYASENLQQGSESTEQKSFADRLKKVRTREQEGRYGTLGLINANLEDECLENDGTQKSQC